MLLDPPHLLLIALFVLTIGHLVTLKFCSVTLDHRTAPIFIGLWTAIGLGATYPFFGDLLWAGLEKMQAAPWLFGLAAIKGVVLYGLFVVSQDLMKVSLSSRHYVTPLSIGFMTIVNSFLGESLTGVQWFSCLGLFFLAVGFFLKGHLADLSRDGKIAYAKLVALAVLLAAVDQVVLPKANWYSYLWVFNTVLLVFALGLNFRQAGIVKAALTHPMAISAGAFYMATELCKFYQMVTINPVSVVVTVQAMTKPVILILSALIWHERTVKEQMAWGLAAFLVTLPLFL